MSTSASHPTRTTASSRAATSRTCCSGARIEVDERKEIRPTSRSGRRPSRASRPGTARGATGGPAGTSSARRCASSDLGEQIDIHGGGNDLIFPHHENEIAQTEA